MSALTWRRTAPAHNTWQARLGEVVVFTIVADAGIVVSDGQAENQRYTWLLKNQLGDEELVRLHKSVLSEVRHEAEVLLAKFLNSAGLMTAPEPPKPSLARVVADEVAKTLSGVIDEPWDSLFPEAPRAAFTTVQQVRAHLEEMGKRDAYADPYDMGDVFGDIDGELDELLTGLRRLGWDQ